jgi:hypothetical protein
VFDKETKIVFVISVLVGLVVSGWLSGYLGLGFELTWLYFNNLVSIFFTLFIVIFTGIFNIFGIIDLFKSGKLSLKK